MAERKTAYLHSTNGGYPAHWRNPKGDEYTLLCAQFLNQQEGYLDLFRKPLRRIEDKNHTELFDYLSFTASEKEGKIGISLVHYFLIALYKEIEGIVGNTPKLTHIIKLLKKRLDFYKKIGKRPMPYFELNMWMSRNFETNLFIYQDNLDFGRLIEENNARFLGIYYDAETRITISLSKIRADLFQKKIEDTVKMKDFHILDQNELDLLLAVNESEGDENALEVTALVEQGKFSGINKKRRMTEDELENIHKLGEKYYFVEVSDLVTHHGKYIKGKLTEKISFDKTKYLSID